ncbi:MAG: glycosyltransferase family 39 protein [Flavobacteriales bacterium]
MSDPLLLRALRSPLLLFGVPVCLASIWAFSAGYQGLNGQDAHDYLRIAKDWTAWSHGGARPEMAEHPHGYPMAGAIIGAFVGSELLALRAISALSLIALAMLVHGLLRRVHPEQQAVPAYVLLAAVLSPFMLRYSMMVMSDVPAMVLVFGSYVCTVQWIKLGRWPWLISALMLTVLALGVRLASAPLLAPMAVALVHGPPIGRKHRWGLAFVLAALAVFALAFNSALIVQGTMDHPLTDWSPLNFFRRVLHSDDGTLTYRFPNGIYVLGIVCHPGFLPMGLLLLPFVRPSDLRPIHARVAGGMLVCYLLFLAGLPFQNDRVLLSALPFVSVLLLPAFNRAVGFWKERIAERMWILAMLAVIQIALFVRAMLPFFDQAQVERDLAARVNALRPSVVYTHGMGAAFGTYCPDTEVQELWYGDLERFERGALFVVRPSNLGEQWQGRPPATNWERAQQQGLELQEERPDGWVLARVR